METVETASSASSSFRRYEKMKELEDKELKYQSRSRRRLVTISVSLALLLMIFAGAAIATILSSHKHNSDKCPSKSSCSSSSSSITTLADSVETVCRFTLYPSSCYAALMSAEQARNATSADPVELFKLSLRLAADELSKATFDPESLAINLTASNATRSYIIQALQICTAMRNDSVEQLNDTLRLFTTSMERLVITPTVVGDMRTWLSAAVTDLQTCLDGFRVVDNGVRPGNATAASIAGVSLPVVEQTRNRVELLLRNATELTSNCLAMATWILNAFQKAHDDEVRRSPPFHGRRLLQLQKNDPAMGDLVVAQDGSGNFTTVTEALSEISEGNPTPFVIYVKAGVYVENVVVSRSKWNVVLIGDGIGKTVISGSKNFADGVPTFNTATFAVEGKGFMARDITFENTAGPENQQAVAVRCQADQAVFYRCSFSGYQDTLYAHSLRQFYRDCDIHGTVDLIFGNAAAVFQGCKIRTRIPLPGQSNTITAQGRSDPNQNTGTSIQGSTIDGDEGVAGNTYLGRPWRDYAAAVFMQSDISRGVVDPRGWSPWTGQASPPPTIFFGEYQNTGPGSSTAGRVQWSGYRPAMTPKEVQRFTLASFIQGIPWISTKGVPYS